MENTKPSKHICLGLLAHVDAGKTTLAEGILYLTGSIRRLGRVDHQDAFLDNYALERERGITIFSKQAELALEDLPVTLMDTPGHVDFSAEMERTLQILDYAVLVISGADGVQGHVETLWRLLARYQVPVFLFVNKMDQQGTDRAALMEELTRRLDGRCVDFGPLYGPIGEYADAAGQNSAETTQQNSAKTAQQNSAKTTQQNPAGAAGQNPAGMPQQVPEEFWESLAMCDEVLLERYLECGELSVEEIAEAVAGRRVFPCYFGSALKLWGVRELLDGIRMYSQAHKYSQAFGARVFKITRDEQGNRLTHMKITGGALHVKDLLTNARPAADIKAADTKATDTKAADQNVTNEIWEQKVNQIRIYSGAGYQTAGEAEAGMVCAVTGLDHTFAGEGLGAETEAEPPLLEPVLSYRIELPPDCDVHRAFLQLRQLEEEEPELHVVWDERLREIQVQLMGEVQIEVLKDMIRERFGLHVTFGSGNIVYKETIANAVEGMGHFEPLRHYAEVHLLLEPGERGSGLQFFSACSEDVLDLNWQRLILTHLEEKRHRGVLTGSEITDMRITLLTGRAHLKHTEGGDFRQATYRAVRHGLKCAQSVLLEPVYEFRLELPADAVGRALADIQRMYGSFAPPELDGETAVITGQAPVVTMRGYQTELLAYTRGRGRLTCTLKGYEECHNAQEVIEACGYDSEADLENPTGSVFCAHGAGYVVSWDQVQNYMHVESGWKPADAGAQPGGAGGTGDGRNANGGRLSGGIGSSAGAQPGSVGKTGDGRNTDGGRMSGGIGSSAGSRTADEKELEAIFTRTYGTSSQERQRYAKSRRVEAPGTARTPKKEPEEEYLLVDGYNIIFAWDELRELAKVSIEGARGRLMDILCNYQGYKNLHLILVFDAYKVEGGRGEVLKYHNIYVIYTKEAETADQYIEKTVREISRKYHVTVATSDALEQIIILGAGAARMSVAGLWEEIQLMNQDLRTNYLQKPSGGKNRLFDHIDGELGAFLEELRLGRIILQKAVEKAPD